MKFSLRSTGESFPPGRLLRQPTRAWLALALGLAVAAPPLPALAATNTLEIQSVTVNGTSLPVRGKEIVNLHSFPESVAFGFGPDTNVGRPPLRLRYTLEGFENVWHEAASEMTLTARFYNGSGERIGQST